MPWHSAATISWNDDWQAVRPATAPAKAIDSAQPLDQHATERTENMARLMDRDRPSQRRVAIRTLGDLGEHNELYAYCDSCRHSRQLDLADLRERYGPELSLKGLRARLRCSRCGARRGQAFHVWDAGPRVQP
jgi:hypothetical protein